MEEIDIKELFKYFKSKLRIIISVLAIVCLAGGFYAIYIQKPVYESYSKIILIGTNSSMTTTDISLNKSLVDAYTDVVTSRRVLSQVIEKLNLDTTYESLASRVKVSGDNSSGIIKIAVSDNNPVLAKDITNAVAYYFTNEVSSLYKLDNVNILDEAIVAEEPSNMSFVKQAAIFVAVGLVLGVGVVFCMYYFDTSIKSSEEVERRTGLKVLSTVHESHRVKKGDLVVESDPKAVISEDIRTVRTNLLLTSGSQSRVFLIASSVPSEGKSFISSNLAAALAQTGKTVIIVDCDMRRGRLNNIFQVKSEPGLAEALSSSKAISTRNCISRTSVSGLNVMARGKTPMNPSELLNNKLRDLVDLLLAHYDYVILDGTPVQGLPDSLTISSIADATILVAAEGYTNMNTLLSTQKMLKNINTRIAGVVLNRVKGNVNGYGKYYGDYYVQVK